MAFTPIVPPDREVYKCTQCDTKVSAIYMLAYANPVCPKCGGELEYDEVASIRNIP